MQGGLQIQGTSAPWKHRPTTRSNTERTFTSRNLSQKHAIACRRAKELTELHDNFPVNAKRSTMSQDVRRHIEHEMGEDRIQSGYTPSKELTTIRRCLSENDRLSVRGTSCKRTAYQRYRDGKYLNVTALSPLGRDDSSYVGTTDLQKLFTELRMTVKLSPLPTLGRLFLYSGNVKRKAVQ